LRRRLRRSERRRPGASTATLPLLAIAARLAVERRISARTAPAQHEKARLVGADLDQILRFVCAAGSLWCGRTQHGSLPNVEDITAMLNN
jgi:hypothetical protein